MVSLKEGITSVSLEKYDLYDLQCIDIYDCSALHSSSQYIFPYPTDHTGHKNNIDEQVCCTGHGGGV